jgi:hypothetical protein
MRQSAIYRLAHHHTLTAQQAEVLCALHCQFGPDHVRESHERITNLFKIAKALEDFRQHQVANQDFDNLASR